MTAGERRLASLAALFVPDRAAALLGRLRSTDAAGAVERAGRLAAAPRRERLQALAAAIAVDPEAARAAGEAAAALERPRVAMLLRALAAGAQSPPASAAVVRLCRERVGR